MTDDTKQQAQAILDRLAFKPFDLCLKIERKLNHLPAKLGIYAIRHQTIGSLYLGKTNDLSARFNGGHKAFTWAWLDLYHPSDVRIANRNPRTMGQSSAIIRSRGSSPSCHRTTL